MRAAPGLQRGQYAVHLAVDGRTRHDDQPVLPLNVCDQIDVAGLMRHRHQALLGERGIEALGLVADRMNLEGPFWSFIGTLNDNFGSLGYLIIAIFVGSWLISIAIYRLGRFDRLEPAG